MLSIVVLISVGLLFLSFILTFFIKQIASRLSIIDIPNERSSHKTPTPRGGGLAIVISWYIGITMLFYFNLIESYLFYALLSGIILAIVSLIDDVIDLPPVVRLLAQITTAVLAFISLNGIDPIQIFGFAMNIKFIVYPVVIIGMVWFINLYNFLDGIDGYVSIEAILVSAILFIFSGNSILLILIACVFGFLIWNWPKAKIFMGDVGSTQLGFILVVLGIYFHNQQQFSILQWFILTSPFWFDATFTLFRRWRNKEKLSQAHKKHAYQRIVQAGFSHFKTDLYLIIINIIILGLVYGAYYYPKFDLLFLLAAILFLYGIVRWVDQRKEFS
ncbi:MAG: glycosyltransferase family 4 protein [Bacteroidetes bacterium]|nr:glycosyltransferase family 4 protein [Bacteroidota bacterium]